MLSGHFRVPRPADESAVRTHRKKSASARERRERDDGGRNPLSAREADVAARVGAEDQRKPSATITRAKARQGGSRLVAQDIRVGAGQTGAGNEEGPSIGPEIDVSGRAQKPQVRLRQSRPPVPPSSPRALPRVGTSVSSRAPQAAAGRAAAKINANALLGQGMPGAVSAGVVRRRIIRPPADQGAQPPREKTGQTQQTPTRRDRPVQGPTRNGKGRLGPTKATSIGRKKGGGIRPDL